MSSGIFCLVACDQTASVQDIRLQKKRPLSGATLFKEAKWRDSMESDRTPFRGPEAAWRNVENWAESEVVQTVAASSLVLGMFTCGTKMENPPGPGDPPWKPSQNQSVRVDSRTTEEQGFRRAVARQMHKPAHWLQPPTFCRKQASLWEGAAIELIGILSCCRPRCAAFPAGSDRGAKARSRPVHSSSAAWRRCCNGSGISRWT